MKNDKKDEEISFKEAFLMMLLDSIPVVNIVLEILWMCGKGGISKKSQQYWQGQFLAQLTLLGMMLILIIVLGVIYLLKFRY